MKESTMIRILIFVSALLLVSCEPKGPIPGGQLTGEVKIVPDNWSAYSEVELLQLETRPDDPYSINIWGVGLGRDYYIASGGGGESSWVDHINNNPAVRLRIENNIFELKAIHITDEDELAQVLKRYKEKYDMEAQGEDAAQAWLFRLDRR
jgi:hypothetical protein